MTQYGCITMDPNWAEYGGGGRGAQNHYALLKRSEISKLILRSGVFNPAPSAHLWCWVTDGHHLDGVSLVDELGFRLVRTFVWIKSDADFGGDCLCHEIDPADKPCICCEARIILAERGLQQGLGQYARSCHEICLFAVRGDAMVPEPANRPASVIFAPRREHSRKPDEFFTQWAERVSPGPRLEMFARSPRPGWDVWGNETTKFVGGCIVT